MPEATDGSGRLKFEIQVEDGRGALHLRPRTFFGWLRVQRLELELPQVSFPLDISRGIAQFQQHACRLVEVDFAIDDHDLAEMVVRRHALLAASGFEDLRVRFVDSAIELSGRARAEGASAEFTGHVCSIPE